MNVPNVEIKTIEYFWDKIINGGIILIDDYCYSSKYTLNKKNFDEFAKIHSIRIYQIPTGQGILIKQKMIKVFKIYKETLQHTSRGGVAVR